VTGFRAEAAMNAGLDVYLQPGAGLFSQDIIDNLLDFFCGQFREAGFGCLVKNLLFRLAF